MSESTQHPAPQGMSIADLVNKQHLELTVEIKALANAVSQLHTVFVKRRVLYWVLGVETFIVACALAALGIFVGIENAHQNTLVNRTVDSCQVRNAQIDSTRAFLTSEFTIQAESAKLTALYLAGLHFKTTPAEDALATQVANDQTKALRQWYASQPPDVPCKQFRGAG